MPDHYCAPDLREVTPADQPFLDALYRSVRSDLTCLGDDPAIDALIAMQQQIHDSGHRSHYPGARHLLLWQDGQAIARLILDANNQRLHIVDISVLASHRSQGAGSALLGWAQQQAVIAKVPLELRVQFNNPGAQRLYRSMGFSRFASDEIAEHMRWQAPVFDTATA